MTKAVNILKKLKRAFPWATYKKSLSSGLDLKIDVPRLLGHRQPSTIVDVGANTGQTFVRFRHCFPEAMIYSFEPVKATYELLRANHGDDTNGVLVQKALGAETRNVSIHVAHESDCSSIKFANNTVGEEVVSQTTLDAFCAEHSISTIDLLKTDTEGWDIEVLKGAAEMLANHSISLIFAETTPTPEVVSCTPFGEMTKFLLGYKYRPYAFYDYGRPYGVLTKPLDVMNVLYVRSD